MMPNFSLGPPPDPKDPRRLQWDNLLWKYLRALSSSLSQASSQVILSFGEQEQEAALLIPGPQGLQGKTGEQGPVGFFQEESEDSYFPVPPFIPDTFSVWSAFTTTRTGWTDVGAPTVTGRFCKVFNVCFFQIKVVPGTTVATTAGTSYCSLPLTAGGLGGEGAMTDATTLVSVGTCVIDVTNSRVYVPNQVATGDTLDITGWYEN